MSEQIKRALVIAGGGAKGAYTLGQLKALEELGFAFDVVCGTSAGSLNAVIWSSGQIDKGEALWSSISGETTYRFSPALKRFGWLAKYLFFLNVFFHLAKQHMLGRQINERISSVFANIAAFIIVIPYAMYFAVLHAFANAQRSDSGIGVFLTVLIGVFIFLLVRRAVRTGGQRAIRKALAIIVPTYISIFLWTLFPIALGLWQDALQLPQIISIGFAVISVVLIGIAILISVAIFLFAIYVASENLISFDSEPLRSTIRNFLTNAPLRIPTFVTVAESLDVLDPNESEWVDLGGKPLPGGARTPSGPFAPNLISRYVPRYVRIDQQELDNASNLLMASAAIPFGVVKAINHKGLTFVDGGVIDNHPMLPALWQGVDEIFVLALQTAKVDSITGFTIAGVERARFLMRLISLSQQPPPIISPTKSAARHSIGEGSVGKDMFSSFPKVRFFSPRSDLGGLWDGTVKFEAGYARELIDHGYSEGLEIFGAIK